jgi:hypothetical protein
MAYMYNKLCNKQNELFSSNRSYLQKGQESPTEFRNTCKSFDLIKSCLFYDKIFIFLFSYIISITTLKVSISCKDILNCYNKKLIIAIL